MILKAVKLLEFESPHNKSIKSLLVSFCPLVSYAAPEILLTAFDPFLTLQLRCCGAEGPEDWARSVFNGFRDLDHAPEIGIPRTQADVVGGMALTAALPKVTIINDFSNLKWSLTSV